MNNDKTEDAARAQLDAFARSQAIVHARIDQPIPGAPRVTYTGRLTKHDDMHYTFALIDQTSVRGFDFNTQHASFGSPNIEVFGKSVELRWQPDRQLGPSTTLRVIFSEKTHV